MNRKCSYCKSAAHDVRTCPSKKKQVPLVRACAKLYFEKLYSELASLGIGPYAIIKVEGKPHYFWSREKEQLIYEPNRTFGTTSSSTSLYGDGNFSGSENTFLVTSTPFRNAGLFGPAYTHVFNTLRNMSEKLYYDSWTKTDFEDFHRYAKSKGQKPKGMAPERFRKILYDLHKRKNFLELASLPMPPASYLSERFQHTRVYGLYADLRSREIFKTSPAYLEAASLCGYKGIPSLIRMLEKEEPELRNAALEEEVGATELLDHFLNRMMEELRGDKDVLQLSEKVEVISASGEKEYDIEKNVSLSVDITEQQWYDVNRSFRKELDVLIKAKKRSFL